MEEIYDSSSHFPCGSVDWNLCRIGLFLSHNQSLPLRKCGLKSLNTAIARMSFSHFPCGSVDWNFKSSISHGLSSVTSLAEVWIEIGEDWTSYKNGSVTSLAEVWIEIQYWSGTQYIKRVTSLAEVWIEISKVVTDNEDEAVTSLAEVWIEIPQNEPF